MFKLNLVEGVQQKRALQKKLVRILKEVLPYQGKRKLNLHSHGGDGLEKVYSAGEGKLYAASFKEIKGRRYWNPFGIYQTGSNALRMDVQINIPIAGNNAAGFFATNEKGDVYLMHSGRMNAVRQDEFLAWITSQTTRELVWVYEKNGKPRAGIVVAKLDIRDAVATVEFIWSFVKHVNEYKKQKSDGVIDTPEFKQCEKKYKEYFKEFSGYVQVKHSGASEYHSIHGEVVDKLKKNLTRRLLRGEKVVKNNLIDLGIEKNGRLSEVYEVKTTTDRPALYTAIGQLVTHAADSNNPKAAKFLVVPAKGDISHDLSKAFKSLGIKVCRFRLNPSKTKVLKISGC